jgi:hypothetical protein
MQERQAPLFIPPEQLAVNARLAQARAGLDTETIQMLARDQGQRIDLARQSVGRLKSAKELAIEGGEVNETQKTRSEAIESPQPEGTVPQHGDEQIPVSQGQQETGGQPVGELRDQKPDVLKSEGEQPSPPAPIHDEPVVSAIANKYTQERTGLGQLGQVTPGQITSVQELATRGQKLVEGGADVDAAITRVMSGTFDPVNDASIVRFREAGLRSRKEQAYRDLQVDPKNVEKQLAYENAFQDLTDFHQGPIATVKTNWAQAGRGLQGSFPVDLSTADGLRDAWLQNTGKDMPEAVRPVAEKVANRVRETVDSENGIKSKLGNAIEDAYSKRTSKLTSDQIREKFLKELENRPCR